MNHESNTSHNSDIECGSNHGLIFNSSSKDAGDAISRASSANWAWAQSGDSYDWMDWHSPFPAVTQAD